ncbi:VOC family protein [Kiloniella sp.]|uniref:VOC family protein n=1 Tax=Kiloniella sp. TaxID=1938587 RepID=UPI003B026058
MPIPTYPAKNQSSALSSMKADHIALRVPDFAASRDWFIEKFDFRVIHQWPFGDLNLAYLAPAADDGFLIELIGGALETPRTKHTDLGASLSEGGSHHICFAVADTKKTLEELRSRGVSVVAEPFVVEDINRLLAFVSDPWDNLFELSQKI